MALLDVDELRALDDPVVNGFLKKQEKLNAEMSTYTLMHMADSFGRPGSCTEGGKRYRSASFEHQAMTLELALYCLLKGYSQLEDYNHLLEQFNGVSSSNS